MKVLLADPENQFKKTVIKVLRDQGYECIEANSTKELKRIVFDEQIDAIAVSQSIFDEDLQDVVTLIRSTEGFSSVPVYLITKTEEIGTAREAYRVGVTEVYTKSDIDLITASFQRIYDFRNKVLDGKVIYIEPDESQAESVLNILQDLHLRVFHYPSVEKALEAFERTQFDIIITCLIAQGKFTGQHLIRRVRGHSNQQKNRTPILVVTEFDDAARQLECFNLGADDFIAKYNVKQELLPRVNNAMAKSEIIVDLKQQAKILQRFAIYDSLSSLYNRRGLLEVAPQIFRESVRQGSPLSLLIIDLDYFKEVNDQYGHAEGDSVIKAVSKVFMSNLKDNDIIARWGGDEFIALLPNCAIDSAQRVGERILLKTRAVRPDTNLSCSIGVAQIDFNKVITLEALIKEADRALYQAKSAGRSRVALAEAPVVMNDAPHWERASD